MMIRLHRTPHRQDGVEIVADPLHAPAVKMLAVLHSDEFGFQKGINTFDCSVLCNPHMDSNGVIAGMALMAAAILDEQQVGIDHHG